jgi:EAL domain-containing protein (putative c-di-GMP-specific phosphodiesterase class I)
MIGMGHNLKLKVLAEGVENEEQITFLNSNGCDNVQGYAVGRPLPPEKLSEFLH